MNRIISEELIEGFLDAKIGMAEFITALRSLPIAPTTDLTGLKLRWDPVLMESVVTLNDLQTHLQNTPTSDLRYILDDVKETSRMVQHDFNGRTGMYWDEWILHLDDAFSDELAQVAALESERDGSRWIDVDESQPELKDDGVLIHFENGSIETVHIEDFFKPITAGVIDGVQQWTKWYLHHNPKPTHWQPLPKAPL